MNARRTYSMLESLGHAPNAYERVSTHLAWRVTRGCALPLPAEQWHRRHGAEVFLGDVPWESFVDPEATTYRSWVARAREREAVASAAFAADGEPSAHAWSTAAIGPLRYAGHALMMLASYLGSFAPSGRVTIVLAFQAGDEMRRVHRFAERLFDVGQGAATLDADARAAWERAPTWRPLRELFERALTTWNWHEAFAACDGIKSVLDPWCTTTLAERARAQGDLALTTLLGSLALDHAWHRAWADALLDLVRTHVPAAATSLVDATEHWRSAAHDAVAALNPWKVEP